MKVLTHNNLVQLQRIRDDWNQAAGYPFSADQKSFADRGIGLTTTQEDIIPEPGAKGRFALRIADDAANLITRALSRGKINQAAKDRIQTALDNAADTLPADWGT